MDELVEIQEYEVTESEVKLVKTTKMSPTGRTLEHQQWLDSLPNPKKAYSHRCSGCGKWFLGRKNWCSPRCATKLFLETIAYREKDK